MKISTQINFALLFSVLFSCCTPKKQPDPIPEVKKGTLEFKFIPRVSGASFVLNNVYQNISKHNFRLSQLKMYFSNLKLVKSDGIELPIQDVWLADYSGTSKTEHGEGVFISLQVPEGDYQGMRFGIGLDSLQNQTNANAKPTTDPLSASKGMYWNPTNGYKFISLEGMVDTSAIGNLPPSTPIQYALGKKDWYMKNDYTKPNYAFSISSSRETQFIVEMDINRLFYSETDTLRMESNRTAQTPTEPELAKIIWDNLKQSIYVRTSY